MQDVETAVPVVPEVLSRVGHCGKHPMFLRTRTEEEPSLLRLSSLCRIDVTLL